MNLEDCPSYENCDAPLCPLYEFKELSVWYPDEDICNKIGRPIWVKKQRRIQKRATDRDSHYTIEMLEAIYGVSKATRGLDAEGKRSEVVFLKRRSKGRTTTTIGKFVKTMPPGKAKEGYDPSDMPNSPHQLSLLN